MNSKNTAQQELQELIVLIKKLRAPDGCPWDQKQTKQDIGKYILDEAYEVLDALIENNPQHIREELGDLLFQILFIAEIASESGEFLLSDVAADIAEKLVRRHPHVFGDVKANDADEAVESWEGVKRRENGGQARPAVSIPRALPALARAQKIARRTKLRANIRDIAARVERLPRARNREKALGEVLFALVAYAAEKHVDAESALRAAVNQKT